MPSTRELGATRTTGSWSSPTIFRVVDECAVYIQRHLAFVPMYRQLFPRDEVLFVRSTAEEDGPCKLSETVTARQHKDAHAARRRWSLTRPWVLVARCTSAARSRSRHAVLMRAAFSISAAERAAVAVLRRPEELTERVGARDERREEAILRAAPASRVDANSIESSPGWQSWAQQAQQAQQTQGAGLAGQRRCCRGIASVCCRGMAVPRWSMRLCFTQTRPCRGAWDA
jgi:hypothetical protein